MTGSEFHAVVTEHLTRATALVPTSVPDDVFDERITPLMDELQALDQLLFGLGAEERRKEDEESARQRRVAAKSARPDVERLVMLLDERTQKLVEFVGDEQKARYITPMFLEHFLLAVVRFLEAVPAAAFAPDAVRLNWANDPTVDGIIALVHQRLGSRASSEETNNG